MGLFLEDTYDEERNSLTEDPPSPVGIDELHLDCRACWQATQAECMKHPSTMIPTRVRVKYLADSYIALAATFEINRLLLADALGYPETTNKSLSELVRETRAKLAS